MILDGFKYTLLYHDNTGGRKTMLDGMKYISVYHNNNNKTKDHCMDCRLSLFTSGFTKTALHICYISPNRHITD